MKHYKMKHLWLAFLLSIFLFNASAQQTISGNFPLLKGQMVRLVGFSGFKIYTIDSTTVDKEGIFKLNYADQDLGMAYIAAADNKPYFVVLAKEQLQIKGEILSDPASIITLKGDENKAFVNYAIEHAKREQALSAWSYLQKFYLNDALFANQKKELQTIASEMQRIKKQDDDFLNHLTPTSYVNWYLPLRKLISSVAVVAQYKTEEIPATIAAFRKIDYADPRLYKSGLLKDAIERHYWLLENRGLPLDTIFRDMNLSTDLLLNGLIKNEPLFNEVTKHLFDYFEKHSLFPSSEYLAVKALSQQSCMLNNDLAKDLESYRKMKKGNTAPDIVFSGDVYKNGLAITKPSSLSEIQSPFKVVIFGASWCPTCAEEMAQLIPLYPKWKARGVEVVFISLDTDQKAFKEFTSVMPFISSCDYKKWDTQAAKDYYVSSSPTIFLLDQNNKILLRPIWVKAIDSWVDYNIESIK